ncbi:MAG: GNAT family N-acetyltransferase [Nitrososphaeraceae archaeon]|jgi:glucosamine-phosphate N-acetyltransferase
MSSKARVNFVIREIQLADLKRGFFDTLSSLSHVGNIADQNDRAEKILSEIKSYPFYTIFVAVKEDNQLIGSITILIEQKFIHNGGKVGHIEDVVTRKEYEGMGIGKALVLKALDFAKENRCYKVILDCSKSNVEFYKKIGFKEHEVSMRIDL